MLAKWASNILWWVLTKYYGISMELRVLLVVVAVLGLGHKFWQQMQNKRMAMEIRKGRMQNAKIKLKRKMEKERNEAGNKRRRMEQQESQIPRLDMLKYAKDVAARPADTEVLQKLEAKGFTSFSDAESFTAKAPDVEDVAEAVLRNTPADMRQDIAKQLHLCSEMRGAREIFTFNDGQGTFAKVLVKSKEVGVRKSIALLAYGISFDCKKAVETWREEVTTTPVLVYEDVPIPVIESRSFFGGETYKVQMQRKLVRTEFEKKTKKFPVFKEEVLNVKELASVMKALEFESSQKALIGMS